MSSNNSKLQISNSLKNECKGDKKCMGKVESISPNNIYINPEVIGSFLAYPSLFPVSENDFKPKCKGAKNYKVYDEVPEKKNAGLKFEPISDVLLVKKEKESDCFMAENNLNAKRELGENCTKDDDCLSNKCSNIKLLPFPGKCVNAPSTGTVSLGLKCEYEADCEKGLVCKEGICSKKENLLKSNDTNKKSKKKPLGGIISSIMPKSKKKKSNNEGKSNLNNKSNNNLNISNLNKNDINNIKNLNNNVNELLQSDFNNDENNNSSKCISQDKLMALINNDDYVSFKENKICDIENCGKSCGKGSYCYKGECYHINPKCKFSKKCLNDKIYRNEKCCDKKSYCKTKKIKREKVSYCEPLENIKNLKNGFYCISDKNCKSNYCNKNLDKCMSKKKKELYCSNDKECQNDDIYGHKFSGCVSNVCVDYHNFPKRSRDLFDTCYKDKDCKHNKCGNQELPNPFFYADSDFTKRCLPKKGSKKQQQKFFRKAEEFLSINETKNLNISSNIDNLNDYKYIFFENVNDKYSSDNRNNLIIFKSGNKFKLGKLIVEKTKTMFGFDEIYTIVFFEGRFNNLNDALNNVKVISSSSSNNFNYAKNKNIKVKKNWYKGNDVFKIENKLVFDYIILKLFGERVVLLNEFDISSDNFNGFYQINNETKNFENNSNNSIYENDEDSITFSIPFKMDFNIISGVESNYNRRNINKIIDFLKKSSYYKLNSNDFFRLQNYGHFDLYFSINSRLKLRKNKKLNRSKSKKHSINNLTNYSIFSELLK